MSFVHEEWTGVFQFFAVAGAADMLSVFLLVSCKSFCFSCKGIILHREIFRRVLRHAVIIVFHKEKGTEQCRIVCDFIELFRKIKGSGTGEVEGHICSSVKTQVNSVRQAR